MRQELFRSAGYYDTNYLKIYVDTEDAFLSFDDKLSDIGAATFLHEYIHYLQDITTTNGLLNICSEVDFVKLLNSKLQNVSTFKVPYQPNITDGNVYINLEMRKVWIGGGTHKSYKGDFEIITENVSVQGFTFTKIILQWGNEETGGVKYSFGSYCICESMAYEIEQSIYPGIIKPDATEFPYLTARKVADKIYPGFSDNVEYLIALCDASLMYTNSGYVFYKRITQMKNEGYKPINAEDVYCYVYRNTKFNYQNISSFLELFFYSGHLANIQVCDYFRSNVFESNSLWIARTLSSAQNIRTQFPHYILDLVRKGDIRKNPVFFDIKFRIGTPIIVNSKSEMFFENVLNGYGFSIKPDFFWVFKEIKSLLTEDWGKRGNSNLCRLKDYCDKSCEDRGEDTFTDIRCRNSPWERADDANPKLCAFGATWKAWGLQGKVLEIRDEQEEINN